MLINTMSKSIELTGFRSTKGLELPSTWVEAKVSRGRLSIARCFHPAEHPDVTVIAYRRGHDLGESAAGQLRKILDAPVHVLDDLERQRVAEVLAERSMRKRFTIQEARTQDYNGKIVLITDGVYADSGDRAFTVFADVLGDGHYVEEFQYAAPVSKFTCHFEAASAILKAIEWSDIP